MIVRLVALLVLAGALVGAALRLRTSPAEECPAGACAPMPQPAATTTLATLAAPPPPRAYDEEDIATWMHGASLGGVGPRHDPTSIWAALDAPWEARDDEADLDAMWAQEEPVTSRRSRVALGSGEEAGGAAAVIEVRIRRADGRSPGLDQRVNLSIDLLGRPEPGSRRRGIDPDDLEGLEPDSAGFIRLIMPSSHLVEGPVVLSGELWESGTGEYLPPTVPLAPARLDLRPGLNGPVTLTAAPGVDLEVQVLDHVGAPAVGLRVRVGTRYDSRNVTTTDAGVARFEALPERAWGGMITVANEPGQTLASTPVAIAGVSARRVVRLGPQPDIGELEVRVLDASGASVESGRDRLRFTRAGPLGRSEELFPWRGLYPPPDVARISAGPVHIDQGWALPDDEYWFAPLDVLVRSGERTVATIVLRPFGTLRLQLKIEDGSTEASVALDGNVKHSAQVRPGEAVDLPAIGPIHVYFPREDGCLGGIGANVDVKSGETTTVHLVLPARGTLVVRTEAFGEPRLYRASPSLRPVRSLGDATFEWRGRPYAVPEDGGRMLTWRFTEVPAGPCEVRLLSTVAIADVVAGVTTTVDLAPEIGLAREDATEERREATPDVPEDATVIVSVIDGEGRTVRGATVVLRQASDGAIVGERPATGGAVSFDVEVGAYLASASDIAHGEGPRAPVMARAGATSDVVVTLGEPATAWVDGRVTSGDAEDATSSLVAKAIRIADAAEATRSPVGADGRFTLGPLSPGAAYRVALEEGRTRISRGTASEEFTLAEGERRVISLSLAATGRVVVRGPRLFEAWVGPSGDPTELRRLAPRDGLAASFGGRLEEGTVRLIGSFDDDYEIDLYRYDALHMVRANTPLDVTVAPAVGTSSLLVTLAGEVSHVRECVDLRGPGIAWMPRTSDRVGSRWVLDRLPAGRYTISSRGGRLLRTFDLAEGAAIDLGTVRLGP